MSDYVSTSLGRVGFALPVPYDPAAVYQKRDTVQYQGSTFVVLREAVTGILPTDDGIHYRMLCQRGADGAGNAKWHTGTAVTGEGTGITVVVPGSDAGDMYLNRETGDIYQARAADTWDFLMNTIGPEPEVTAETVLAMNPDGGNSTVQAELDRLEDKGAADIPAYSLDADEGEGPDSTVQALLDALPDIISAAILASDKKKFPVGTILSNLTGENPATYMGFGTWVRWGQGRGLVGVQESDTDFNVAEKTGGEKTHILTIGELPLHSHDFRWTSSQGTTGADAFLFATGIALQNPTGGRNVSSLTQPVGSGYGHNNLQPYITGYMWKRTA